MASPGFGAGDAYYIISPGAINLNFCGTKIISKVMKANTFGMNKFNTIAIISPAVLVLKIKEYTIKSA